MDELQASLFRECGREFSYSVFCRALNRYGLPRIQLNAKAAQCNQLLFDQCKARLKEYNPNQFVFLDETHVDDKSARRKHGRGQMKKGFTKLMFSREKFTVIAAINLSGFIMEACTSIPFLPGVGVTAERFIEWAKRDFAPSLGNFMCGEPNSIVVLDNASVHAAMFDELKRIIHQRGAVIEFLSPYSPDLNPIENAFSKFKAMIKRFRMDYLSNAGQTIRRCLAMISSDDANGYYRNAGLIAPETSPISVLDKKRKLTALCVASAVLATSAAAMAVVGAKRQRRL